MALNKYIFLWDLLLSFSVLLMEETGIPRENHWPAASHWQTLPHNVA